jgi:hypothetical protein
MIGLHVWKSDVARPLAFHSHSAVSEMVFELGVPMFRIVFYCRKSHGTTRKRL